MATRNETFFEALLSPKAAKWSAGVAFNRSNPLPLDQWSVFEDLAAATDYLSAANAYPGQVIAYAEESGEMTVCVLSQNTEGTALTLKPVGTIPVGDDKTIEVSAAGAISLFGSSDAEIGTLPMVEEVEVDGEKKTQLVWKTLEDIGAGDGNDNTTCEFKFENQKITVTPKFNGVAQTAIELDLSDFVTSTELSDVVGKAAEGETAATGIYKAIADALAEAKSYADENDDNDNTTYTLTYGDNEDASKKVIRLIDNANNVISEIDASAFIADGVLNNVEYDKDNDKLIFTWNIVESVEGDKINYKTVEVDVKDLVDTYTNGDGLNLDNNKFSVKIDSTSESFLTVGADGIKLAGVQNAIDTAASNAQSAAEATAAADATTKANQALTDAKTDAANIYATQAYVGSFSTGEDDYKDLDTVVAYINKKAEETLKAAQGGSSETTASVALALQNYKNENDSKVKANTDKLALIEDSAQVNIIETVKVNGTALQIADKAVDITVPTKVSDLTNDRGYITNIRVPETVKDGEGNTTYQSMLTVSQSASSTSEQPVLVIDDSAIQATIKTISDAADTHKTKQTAVANKITDAAHVISSLTQNENGEIAYQVKALTPADIGAQVAGNYKTVQDEKTGTLTGAQVINTWTQGANGELAITTRNLTPADIGAQVAGDYALKSELPTNYKTKQNAIADPTASEFTGTVLSYIDTLSQNENGEITATKKSFDLAKAIGNLTNVMNFRGVVPVQENSNIAADVAAAGITNVENGDIILYGEKEYIYVSANSQGWTEFGDAAGTLASAKSYTDSSIAALQASIHGVDDDTIKLNENKVYVAKVSTDVLAQGEQELVLCAGNASGYHTTH